MTALPLSLSLLKELNQPIPRYTSYPTAPHWEELGEESYREHLAQLAKRGRPLSLYLHIPFCHSMCLFCGCSVVLNRRPEREERYVDALLGEWDLVRKELRGAGPIRQLHFGGGTPTKLTISQLERIMEALYSGWEVDREGEISIEIDPRTVVADGGEKLRALRSLGFSRVSLGVQDTDPSVQEAVKRRQSKEVTERTVALAKESGFSGINLDLIYGLPKQSEETFAKTIEAVSSMRPDRIALFSYAHVPWMKGHQKALEKLGLPSAEEKLALYLLARNRLVEAGYIALGMDHFVLPGDPLEIAMGAGKVYRNFQGYSLQLAEEMIGLGMTAIGFSGSAYFQNAKTLEEYHERIGTGHLATVRGKIFSAEDQRRYWVIQELMCRFCVKERDYAERFGRSFFADFADELTKLDQRLCRRTPEGILSTELGKLFIRNSASLFDAYLAAAKGRHALAV